MLGRAFAATAATSLALGLTLGVTAHAAEPEAHGTAAAVASSGPTPDAPPQVEIAVVAETPNAGALAARIVSWFHGAAGHAHASTPKGLDSSTVFAPTAAPGVRVWVLLRSAASARLFFAVEERAGGAPRYLVNDIALDTGLDELGMEQLAQVVYLSAMALWAGNVESSRSEVEASLRQTSIAKEKSVRAAPAVVAPFAQASADRARLTARLGVEASERFGAELGLPRVGVTFGVLAQRSSALIGVHLHADVAVPETVQRSGLDLAFSGEGLRLGVLGERKLSGKSWVGAELGTGLDVVRYRVSPETSTALRLAPGGTDVRPLVYLSSFARWTVGPFSFRGGPEVVVQLEHTHYDILDDSAAGGSSSSNNHAPIYTPWVVQPGLALGAAW